LHNNVGQFRRHFTYMLETYGGMKATDYPGWAWDVFDRYDKDTFSPEMLLDLALFVSNRDNVRCFRPSASRQESAASG
jgi:hypothetical protein